MFLLHCTAVLMLVLHMECVLLDSFINMLPDLRIKSAFFTHNFSILSLPPPNGYINRLIVHVSSLAKSFILQPV